MHSKYLLASSFIPTQWDNLNIYKFSAPNETDNVFIPLLVISVFLNSIVLSLFI